MVTSPGSGVDAADIGDLLHEYERALEYTDSLWRDLSSDDVHWRPHEGFSPIGWHLGHQGVVAHFMLRNLIAAEPSPDPDFDAWMDSSTPEPHRHRLPDVDRIADYRVSVATRVRDRTRAIADGDVEAPAQMEVIARTLLVAVVNHEYQHSKWIGEVRHDLLGHRLPAPPQSPLLTTVDGYQVVTG